MKLSDYNFIEVGEWELNSKDETKITFKLEKFEKARVIYAFVVEDQVKYIGICEASTTSLKDRMNKYKYLQGGSTNKKIAKEIRKHLEKGKIVKIFALNPSEDLKYKGLKIDLVRGLEYPLIETFQPKWNKQGKTNKS